jgi:hypothetical protein
VHLAKGRFKRKNGHSARSCKNARANSQIDHIHAHKSRTQARSILALALARARARIHTDIRYRAPRPGIGMPHEACISPIKKIRTDRFSYSLLINEFLESNNAILNDEILR